MSYRPLINREEYHNLEVYFFKLLIFVNSVEFKDLGNDKKDKITHELHYIYIAIGILSNLFNQQGKGETRVVAWRDNKSIMKIRDEYLELIETKDYDRKAYDLLILKAELEQAQLDTHIVYHFSCMRVAGDALSCNHKKVSAVCSGKREQTGGYKFMYEEDFINNEPIRDDKIANKLIIGHGR